MRVVVSDRAEVDLEDVCDYIAFDSVRNARKYVSGLRRKMKSLGRTPRIHPVREDLPGQMRAAVYGNHLILYIVEAKTVEIARVIHGAMDVRRAIET